MKAAAGLLLVFLSCTQATQLYANSTDPIRAFLQDYIRLNWPRLPPDYSTRYSAAPVTLNGHLSTIMVYLSGRGWCGTGGCTALLVKRNHSSSKVIMMITLVRLPMRILPSETKGWHDILMPMAGGGVTQHLAIMRFNGRQYQYDSSAYQYDSSAAAARTKQVPKKAITVPLSGYGDLLYD